MKDEGTAPALMVEPKVVTSAVRLSPTLHTQLKEEAARRHTGMSTLIREAVAHMLEGSRLRKVPQYKTITEVKVKNFQYNHNQGVWLILPINNMGEVVYDLIDGTTLSFETKSWAVKRAKSLARVFNLDTVRVYFRTKQGEFEEVSSYDG
jgi:hypothetical protein